MILGRAQIIAPKPGGCCQGDPYKPAGSHLLAVAPGSWGCSTPGCPGSALTGGWHKGSEDSRASAELEQGYWIPLCLSCGILPFEILLLYKMGEDDAVAH